MNKTTIKVGIFHKIIEKISDKIMDEIDCAEEYIKCALTYKEERPQLAEVFYRITNEKMAHMNLLHGQVVAIIDEYRKKNGEPPEVQKAIIFLFDKSILSKNDLTTFGAIPHQIGKPT